MWQVPVVIPKLQQNRVPVQWIWLMLATVSELVLERACAANRLTLICRHLPMASKQVLKERMVSIRKPRCVDVMMKFQTSLMEKQIQTEKQATEAAIQKEQKFLKENKQKNGVSATKSGLQYRVLKSGNGNQPTSNDSVTVHYRGTLTDGTVFDSSYERGEPVTFQVARVISGWSEALQLMHEGDKWQIYIPSDLAYGPRGAGGRIGPNETLVFEVELIKVGSAETDNNKVSKDIS